MFRHGIKWFTWSYPGSDEKVRFASHTAFLSTSTYTLHLTPYTSASTAYMNATILQHTPFEYGKNTLQPLLWQAHILPLLFSTSINKSLNVYWRASTVTSDEADVLINLEGQFPLHYTKHFEVLKLTCELKVNRWTVFPLNSGHNSFTSFYCQIARKHLIHQHLFRTVKTVSEVISFLQWGQNSTGIAAIPDSNL